MEKLNIFRHLPVLPQNEELFEKIIGGKIEIERIVSTGQSSPPDFYYEQEKNEFVILLKGAASLEIEGQIIDLLPGDYLNIPAMTRHRVIKTDTETHTIWLAVHY